MLFKAESREIPHKVESSRTKSRKTAFNIHSSREDRLTYSTSFVKWSYVYFLFEDG